MGEGVFQEGPPRGFAPPVLARFRRPWGALWKTPSPKAPFGSLWKLHYHYHKQEGEGEEGGGRFLHLLLPLPLLLLVVVVENGPITKCADSSVQGTVERGQRLCPCPRGPPQDRAMTMIKGDSEKDPQRRPKRRPTRGRRGPEIDPSWDT